MISKRRLFITLFMVVILMTTVLVMNKPAVAPQNDSIQKVVLGDKTFQLTVADTQLNRQRGLADSKVLANDQGMLFVFDQPDKACFWMKDMQFEIDILWFDQDKKLVDIKKYATPSSYPEYFCPPIPAKYVIELLAGTTDKLQIKIGNTFGQMANDQ